MKWGQNTGKNNIYIIFSKRDCSTLIRACSELSDLVPVSKSYKEN